MPKIGKHSGPTMEGNPYMQPEVSNGEREEEEEVQPSVGTDYSTSSEPPQTNEGSNGLDLSLPVPETESRSLPEQEATNTADFVAGAPSEEVEEPKTTRRRKGY